MMRSESPSNKPRVMHVVPRLDNGGVERFLLDLIDNTPDIETSVIAVNSGGNYKKDFEGRCPTVVLANEEDDPRRTYGWFKPEPILRLVREMRDLRPNIVQTHTFAAATMGRAAAKLAGIPVIIDTLHNTYTWKDSRALRIDRFLGKFTDQIVCVSEAVRNYAIDQNPSIPSSKHSVIYNGVNTDRYHPRDNKLEIRKRFDIAEDELIVGSVSRLVGQKRTKDLVAAAPRVLDQFPKTRFLIAGNGPTSDGLKRQVRDLGLEQEFIFSGMLDDTENIYPALDIFAQTAEREGFGLSLAEAMASGTTAVAARTGAIPELIQDGKNAVLYEVGDSEALARNINGLLGAPDRRRLLGARAAHDIRTNFTIGSTANNYRQLWIRLLAIKGTTS